MTFALIILGVAIGLAGSFSSGLGYFIIRKLHNRIVDDLMSTGDFDSSTFFLFLTFFLFEDHTCLLSPTTSMYIIRESGVKG